MTDTYDPEEGMAEDVISQVRRALKTPLSLQEALAPKGASKGLPGASPEAQSHDYVTFRGPLGVSQVAFSHYPILKALWTLSATKRRDGEQPGITAMEIAEALGEPPTRVQPALKMMAKNGVIRAITKTTGFRGIRKQYLPTNFGVKLFALAEELGYGVQIQIGKTARAWKARSLTEPMGVFERAKLITGSIA